MGGAVKKELERSTQALDAMNVDLAKKIEENGNNLSIILQQVIDKDFLLRRTAA